MNIQQQRNHKLSEHGIGDTCSECGKIFSYAPDARKCYRLCTKQFKHQCEFCGKGFVMSSYYKRHMLEHSGARPHRCTYCEYRSAQTSAVYRHMRTIHENNILLNETIYSIENIYQ